MYLSVIIPSRNEEHSIRDTLQSVYAYLSSKNISHEILVIENNSTDNTAEAARSAGIPTVEVFSYKITDRKIGKGFAVKEGILKAKGEFQLFMDADNSTKIDTIERAMPFFEQGYSVVIGSIGIKGAVIAGGSEPGWRRIFGKLGNLFIQSIAVPGIKDTQRGFKVFTAKAAKDIFSRVTIYGFGFDIEVLALARKMGYKIKEIPINWDNDITNSKVSLRSYFQVLLEAMKIKWNLLTGKYKK